MPVKVYVLFISCLVLNDTCLSVYRCAYAAMIKVINLISACTHSKIHAHNGSRTLVAYYRDNPKGIYGVWIKACHDIILLQNLLNKRSVCGGKKVIKLLWIFIFQTDNLYTLAAAKIHGFYNYLILILQKFFKFRLIFTVNIKPVTTYIILKSLVKFLLFIKNLTCLLVIQSFHILIIFSSCENFPALIFI